MIKSFIIFPFTVLVLQNVYSQSTGNDTAKERKTFWLASSLGYSSLGSLSASLNANIEIGNHYVLTCQVQREFDNLVIFGTDRPSTKYVNTNSLLIGKLHNQNSTFYSISSGLSMVNVDARKGTEVRGMKSRVAEMRFALGRSRR